MLIKALEQERNTLRQEGYDLGKQDGIDLGEQQGIEKGIEKGIEAQRQTLLRLVEWRFALAEDMLQAYARQLARIHTLDHLLHLVDQLLTMQTSAEFDRAILACLPGDEEDK